MSSENPDLRWFELFGRCGGCGRPAAGILRNNLNANMGPYCQRCATTRLGRAKLERERLEKKEVDIGKPSL